jgi:hypothetical protein
VVHDSYVRQLRDMKFSPDLSALDEAAMKMTEQIRS